MGEVPSDVDVETNFSAKVLLGCIFMGVSMKYLKCICWGEMLLWLGFVGSMAYIGESNDGTFLRASVAAGLFAFAAIGVRATRQGRH